jgi:hypothetical protein
LARLLANAADNFTTIDFWRLWVVHLWVEDFLELFTTVMVAYIFVMLGVIRERVALTVIYLDIDTCTRSAGWSARCTTSTSRVSRPSTWLDGGLGSALTTAPPHNSSST